MPDVSTVAVTEGDIVDSVGATGALEAVTTVQVGSQVSGIIQELHVDFNSIVREGDVIMRLDPSLFETQLEQAPTQRASSGSIPARSGSRLRTPQSVEIGHGSPTSPPCSRPAQNCFGWSMPIARATRKRTGTRYTNVLNDFEAS